MPRLRPLLATAILLCQCGCAQLQIGPAHPERDGRLALEEAGQPAALVDAVVTGGPLTPGQVLAFSRSDSADVRFLVARNPHLTPAQIEPFLRHRDDFTRSGAATNPGLSTNQVATLAADASHTVYAQLAGNPALSDAQLLALHTTRNPGLLWFALNPNCPPSIRAAIQQSTDTLARHWLGVVDGWKRDGTLETGPDGRWRRPPVKDR